MDRLDRIYALHKILCAARRPVSRRQLAERLECTESTVYRVSHALETHFGAPIEREKTTGDLYYAPDEAERFELPGLWFNASELHALLTADQLLADVQPGLLAEELQPLRKRIRAILDHRHLGGGELARRMRILAIADRAVEVGAFRTLASALIQRRRLVFHYDPRSRDAPGERRVSPQRLTRYRDNWYLDAWCHERNDLRSFSLDRIDNPRTLERAAKEIDDARLNHHFTAAYGIFAGEPEHTAVLHFDPERAKWIASETWHPKQQGRWLDDGRYELRIPYGNPTELILDILRYGEEVEVIEPEQLRQAVAAKLAQAVARYREKS
jgi:predicted DNA-binding transcriptional regulator YafY